MVNEVTVALLWGLFGFKITAIYVAFGVTLAIVTGFVVGLLRLREVGRAVCVEAAERGYWLGGCGTRAAYA